MAWLLVTARHLKIVPGRQTDVKDCAWIAQLFQYGLLRASCVPSPAVRQWRDRTRHRAKRIDQHTAVVKRVHKTLEEANIKLSTVLSDIRGVSGRRRLRAMAAGEDDVSVLAALGHERLHATPAALPERLQGTLSTHHRFMRTTLVAQVAFLEQQMARLDAHLAEQMRPCEGQRTRLDSIDGIDRRGAHNL